MPSLNVTFTEAELEGVRAAAAADGKSLKQYLHDLGVRGYAAQAVRRRRHRLGRPAARRVRRRVPRRGAARRAPGRIRGRLMHLTIDVAWLLDVQEAALAREDMSVSDYSAPSRPSPGTRPSCPRSPRPTRTRPGAPPH